MKFARVDHEIIACSRHLKTLASLPQPYSLPAKELIEIEAFLSRYLLISIYAEFEQAIDRLVRARADLVTDTAVRGFVVSAADRLLSHINVSDLTGFLARFDEDCKNQFRAAIDDKHQPYINLLQNRHLTAHGSGSLMTLEEVCDTLDAATHVLDAFHWALAMTAHVK